MRYQSLLPWLVCVTGFLLGWGVSASLTPHDDPPQSQLQAAAPDTATTVSPADPEIGPPANGDWPQWGGSSVRNNTPQGNNIPTFWNVGSFDRRTGDWNPTGAENLKWVSRVGSQTYGNPVVADRRVFVGTNNGAGYLPRYPSEMDLGCLLAFAEEDGSLLWQDSSEKLPTGRVHDWPLQGICCAPLIEGNRGWYVTSRGEVVCFDTEGFYDNEDDGPLQAGWGRLFKTPPDITSGLNDDRLGAALQALLSGAGISLEGRTRVTTQSEDRVWLLTIRSDDQRRFYRLSVNDGTMTVSQLQSAEDDGAGTTMVSAPIDLTAGLSEGTPAAALTDLLAARGLRFNDQPRVTGSQPEREWTLEGQTDSGPRLVRLSRGGPNLQAFKQITLSDKHEADRVWVFDMMAELGVSQHNMCSCSVTALGDILFVCTSNGVDESHINLPANKAPSFIAMDKNTGQVLWTDNSPGENILHGQWASPAVGVLGGVAQVMFPGGDGWLYSFRADRGKDGKPELLWKFDANPKESEWVLGGRGTRNNIIATPVIFQQRVFIAVGQDPEHGEGIGHLWCVDPTRRGDVSPQLVVHVNDRTLPLPHRRLKALDETEGEIAIDNPNSAVIWHYSMFDRDGDGEVAFEETMHRSCGTVAIKDDLLFVADFSGVFHCVDAVNGEPHWTYDMLSAAWGSPLIVDGHVFIGDEDGELAVFKFTAEPHEPLAEIDMKNSLYSTPIVAHHVLYISNKTHLFAIANPQQQ